ncbi:MAG TPA: [protein-PII] uridylyltransferase, partial [Gammaproteobacteria bacterium]|nr:[protein-PII] uridylyltransferase [Gammaproteobacteria bacterium]
MLQSARDTLHEAHIKGAASTAIIDAWTWFVDQLLITIWHQHTQDDPQADCCSLVAVGGYGRSELHPSSDIDLMILVTDRDEPHFIESSKQFLHLLWDIGLDVGHSVRTIDECITESSDLTVITNLMEARLLCGSQ